MAYTHQTLSKAPRQPNIATALQCIAVFAELGVSLSIYSRGTWQGLHHFPGNIVESEVEHGRAVMRWKYNERCLARVSRDRRSLRGEHAGFFDLFVPIETAGNVGSVLIVGPFALAPPTSSQMADRWYELAHAHAALSDPEFARYMAAALATLTLEAPLAEAFERLTCRLAVLLGGTSSPEEAEAEVAALAEKLRRARAAEQMWEAARSMVDDRTAHIWSTAIKRDPLRRLGMKHAPQHALVGFLGSQRDEIDPIDEALRCRAFQRAVADLSWRRGNVVTGQVGDRGIALLMTARGSGANARASLLELSSRLAQSARRFGFKLHVGLAEGTRAQELPDRYRAALAAAERALSQRSSVAFAGDSTEPSARNLMRLQTRLVESVVGSSRSLLARFEQYADAVAQRAGYQLEVTRALLEMGLHRLLEPLLASGQLDQRSFDELSGLAEGAETSGSIAALVNIYRGVVSDVERAVTDALTARRSRSTRRARRFMREHLSEPLTLPQVARVAGFAPNYFSRLLKSEEGLTFEGYLRKLRLERAKRTLTGTSLSVARIAELSGMRRTYFQRAFRLYAGATPSQYRRRAVSLAR